jgi:hypothetical protein
MARNPGADNDGIRPAIRQRERVRGLRIRPRGHAETKTFLVGGDITTGMYIPPFFAAVNPHDEDGDNAWPNMPEFKTIYRLRGILNTGLVTIEWTLNGSIFATQDLSTVAATGVVTLDSPGIELAEGDMIQPTIADDSGAADMAACVVILTSPS